MNLSDAFDVLNNADPFTDEWDDAFDLLLEHGLSWSYSYANNLFALIDFASLWSYKG